MTYNIQWYNTVQVDCHDSSRISSSDNTFSHQNNHKGTLRPRWKFPPNTGRRVNTGVGTADFTVRRGIRTRGTPVARTEKRLGSADSDRWVSVARCIDWPIWQEKNAAVANTWPQPAEWPAEHYNAACVSFLPTRRRPSPSTIRAIRVISASSPDLTNCNLILEPRKPSSTPHLLYSPTYKLPFSPRPPATQGDSAWEPGQFDEKTCVFLLQGRSLEFIDRVGSRESDPFGNWTESPRTTIFFNFFCG